MKKILLIAVGTMLLFGCQETKKNTNESDIISEENTSSDQETFAQNELFTVTPISHATMVLKWDGQVLFVDPVGGPAAFQNFDEPDLILITDIHGDHLNIETLEGIVTENTTVLAPKAVSDKLPESLQAKTTILNNGDDHAVLGFTVTAIPMYNLREEALKFHEKGRGNGYVLEKDGKRIYISGDTEDIPEMRNLENIDIAFVCMNLPYTMPVASAADAVLEFKPNIVYPYHYRGTEGLSDVDEFAEIIAKANADIKVTQLDWYPERE